MSDGGINGTFYYWWGVKIFINHDGTQQIIKLLREAAGASAIGSLLAALGLGPIGFVIPAVLLLDSFLLEALDAMGGNQGVVINVTWLLVTWEWHQ